MRIDRDPAEQTDIAALDADGYAAAIPGLAALLIDAVEGGASVNFLAGVTAETWGAAPEDAAVRILPLDALLPDVPAAELTERGATRASHASTAMMMSTECSIPIFTASIVMSASSAVSCAVKKSAGGACTAVTPCVFCAVRVVIAAMPYP